jgi:hypothetical protein
LQEIYRREEGSGKHSPVNPENFLVIYLKLPALSINIW